MLFPTAYQCSGRGRLRFSASARLGVLVLVTIFSMVTRHDNDDRRPLASDVLLELVDSPDEASDSPEVEADMSWLDILKYLPTTEIPLVLEKHIRGQLDSGTPEPPAPATRGDDARPSLSPGDSEGAPTGSAGSAVEDGIIKPHRQAPLVTPPLVSPEVSTSAPVVAGKGRKKRGQQQQQQQQQRDGGKDAVKSELQELWQHAKTIYDAKGHILQLATDQWGCRFVQLRLDSVDEGEANLIVSELLEHITDLSTDSYGNYVVQKMIEASAANKTRLGLIVEQLVGEVFRLSVHVYGCRVIQRAISATCVPLPQQHALLVSELKGRIQECAEDAHGNHVIQKIIEVERPVQKLQFIVDALTPSASWLAAHACGCRVIQRLLETCPTDMITKMRTSIVRACAELSTNSFGNYVIQHVIVYGTQRDRKAIYSYVMEDFAAASCHKFSTNVVDKCLQHLSMSELAHVISVVLGDSGDEAASIVAWGGTAGEAAALSVMLRDRYGCAIVSRLLELAPSEMIERSRLVWKLKEQLPALRKSSFAKHLVAAVESTHAGSVPPVFGQFSRQLSGH
ncbi:hypothetical protein FOZ62_003499 [Perkinsus olseni]|uniref:PUM-HD domain-containing protein n=1 Tax=Perkinsus olseni TaxID=32597 RepID=A0A7J6SAZ5_PEROL|nr:hypothetical protein FOZ62_003499 [Perkinsus olseni]